MVINDMKIFTIIKEKSERIPDKNFIEINGYPLWWHLMSELDGLDITVNTDSPKFIKQLGNIIPIKMISKQKSKTGGIPFGVTGSIERPNFSLR